MLFFFFFLNKRNKCDLEAEREVTKQQGEELARELDCKFMETSAKAIINVTEAFHTTVREIKQWRKRNRIKEKGPEKPNKACCSLL